MNIGILESSQKGSGNPSTYDDDAYAFFQAASIDDTAQKDAIDALVVGMKADGLWIKLKALYPFVGGTAAKHKWNLKDPRDTDLAFRLTFIGGLTHASTGVDPNGTTGYANTHFVPTGNLALNSISMGYYSRENTPSGGKVEIGCQNSGGLPAALIRIQETNQFRSGFYNGSTGGDWVFASNTNSQGFFIGTRTSNVLNIAYKDGVEIGRKTTTAYGNQPTIPAYLFAYNDIGVTKLFTDRECSFAFIGDGLTATDVTNLNTLVQQFQTDLGR